MESVRLQCCAALEGDPVVGPGGEELGVVAHVMVDLKRGAATYAIVARGGVLGIGERLYAVPWKALQRDAARARFLTHVDAERLEASPSFDRDHWPAMDAEWARHIDSHFMPRPLRTV